jgi:Ca2+-binding EF-hand superfamily protein
VAICALKLRARDDDEPDAGQARELDHAFALFTAGSEGPISLPMLKRVAASLKEDVAEDVLRDMILEANGGRGIARGVNREEFDAVMRRAGMLR